MDLSALIADPHAVALRMRQPLEPIEGRELPLFPPTYPTSKDAKKHAHDTPYTVNVLRGGGKPETRIASLDSVQSQANRMEAVFAGAFAGSVPRVGVKVGARTVLVTELPHRLADAALRCTSLEDEIRKAFTAYGGGDAVPIARLSPTSLVYGVWDSRDTKVKIPRAVRSEILAYDIDVCTRSAQFSGAFTKEELGFTDDEWNKGAEKGFAPTPSVDQHGGVIVHGEIVQFASIHLGALRALPTAKPEHALALARYALALALVGLLHGARDYRLRVGCWLVPNGPAQFEVVRGDGGAEPVAITPEQAATWLDEAAQAAQAQLGVPLGGDDQVLDYQPAAGKRASKKKQDPAD